MLFSDFSDGSEDPYIFLTPKDPKDWYSCKEHSSAFDSENVRTGEDVVWQARAEAKREGFLVNRELQICIDTSDFTGFHA